MNTSLAAAWLRPWCLAAVTAIVAFPAIADDSSPPPSIVFMDKGLEVKGSVPRCHQPASLTRELLRQAFLVSARDELGLATRDAWLGSEMPGADAAGVNPPFDVAFVLAENDYEARLVRGLGGKRTKVPGTSIALEIDANYMGLLEKVEQASRTTFVKGLRAAGFETHPADPEVDGDITSRSLAALDHLDTVALFAAIRHFHAIRGGDDVDEQARLGGLARGYALLGLLTEHCWHPLSKALKARGLIYAQRMVAAAPKSPQGCWHRGYALALTGLHSAALDDLARAEQLAATSDNPSPPAWVPAIDAFCRMDITALKASRPNAGVVADLLEFVAFDQAWCGPQATEVGLELLKEEPSCLWLMDALAKIGYLGACHVATETAAITAATSLVAECVRLDGFPDDVAPKRHVPPRGAAGAGTGPHDLDFEPVASLAQRLLDRGRLDAGGQPDRGEPRFETLGLLLRELAWMAVFDRGKFERLQYGVPADEWLSVTRPISALHPYGDIVLLYSSDPAVRSKATVTALAYRPDVIEHAMLPFFDRTIPFDDKRRATLSRVAGRFADDTAGELSRFLRYTSADDASFDYWWSRLRAVSANSPAICLLAIKRDRADQPGDAEARSRQAEQFASVATLLGRRHLDREEYDAADTMLERAAKLSHDPLTYGLWATVHERNGNQARGLEILEAALEEPDYGLGHADIRCRIAASLLHAAKPDEALPPAEMAARTYSGVAIDLLGQCYEAQRKWDRAEAVFKAGAERYPGTVGWYAFCRRTGEGDARAAEAQLRGVLESGQLDPMRATDAAYELARLAGDAAAMRRAVETVPAIAGHPSHQLLFLLNDQPPPTGEALAKKLDGVIAAATAGDGPGVGGARPELVALAKAIAEVGLEPQGRIDAAPLHDAATKIDSRKRCSLQYLLGLVLEREGRNDEAVAAWTECLKLADIAYSMRTLAGAKLVAHGVSADDFPPLEPLDGE